ncbi:MAG: flagellar hook-basal body complex protein FliE [Thermodesulfobacteriota bacterium]
MSIEISNPAASSGIITGLEDAGQSGSAKSPADSFGQMLDETARNLNEADRSILEANTGGPVDLHDVMIAMEKADISLQTLVQVRNKAVDAYDKIMNMQV